MPVTIAASSSTHFLWNGNPMPRVYRVVPHGALDARLESVDDRTWMLVPLGSAVSGSEPANRDALVAALAGIVSPAVGGGGGGGGDVDPGAIGSAVNAAIRGGGALPEPSFGPDTAGTITTGGTAQQVLAAAGSPRYIMLTNDGAGDLRLVVGAGSSPSATTGKLIEPGGSFAIRTAEPIYVWGATTGQAYSHSVEVVV